MGPQAQVAKEKDELKQPGRAWEERSDSGTAPRKQPAPQPVHRRLAEPTKASPPPPPVPLADPVPAFLTRTSCRTPPTPSTGAERWECLACASGAKHDHAPDPPSPVDRFASDISLRRVRDKYELLYAARHSLASGKGNGLRPIDALQPLPGLRPIGPQDPVAAHNPVAHPPGQQPRTQAHLQPLPVDVRRRVTTAPSQVCALS